MVDGVEMVSNIIARCYAIERLYPQQGIPTSLEEQLEQSLIRLYSEIFTYLVESKKFYTQNTASSSVNTNKWIDGWLWRIERLAKSIVNVKESKVDAFLQKISAAQANVSDCTRLIDKKGMTLRQRTFN